MVYEDTNLYNDMGMTPVLPVKEKVNFSVSYRMSFFEKVKMHKDSCEG